jgi:hypothetical protein
VFVSDVMEEKCLQECEINPNIQIKTNQNPEIENNSNKIIKLYAQRTIWKSHGKKNYVGFFWRD